MAQNVCFLFGINGVGKSTLARSLAATIPGAVTINASEALRTAIGATLREELEQMEPKKKREIFRWSLLHTFHQHASAPLIICDTHLVVTIRNDHGCHHELMWDQDFEPYAKRLLYLTAPLETIRQRRERDMRLTSRIRSLCPKEIGEDEHLNRSTFHELFTVHPGSRVIENLDRS